MIDADTATRFARIALGHVGRAYPHLLMHTFGSDADGGTPRALHPIFYGSYDWHSCVHGWWLLLTMARMHPTLPTSIETMERAAALFTPENMAAERAYFDRPLAGGYERPYGWAWVLALHTTAGPWQPVVEPFARDMSERFRRHLPSLTYPIRTGTHFSTAFACLLALEWADAYDTPLAALIRARAQDWFGADRDCPAWEPEGDAFLSPALIEAAFMQKVLGADFAPWLHAFLPRLAEGQPATLFTPAHVSDRTDGKIAHLDGVNLSRAWCWRRLAPALPDVAAETLAEAHLNASIGAIDGHYMGSHWLATFAALALLPTLPGDC